jgi:flagellin
MAINDITLTAGMRSNLIALQETTNLLTRTQERLSTGKKVNSALDNATAYFAAQQLTSRASDLSSLKDAMSQAIQTVKAADAGISAISKLIDAAKGLAQSAYSEDAEGREDLAAQFDELLAQIDTLAADSGYKGINLLDSGSLSVTFDENGNSTMTVTGFDASSSGLSVAAAAGDWATDGNIDTAVTNLENAISTLRTESSSLSSSMVVITTRQEFTTNMISALTTGADKLTLADLNEEGANMLALQTRQSLSTTALSLASSAAQSVLRLFA